MLIEYQTETQDQHPIQFRAEYNGEACFLVIQLNSRAPHLAAGDQALEGLDQGCLDGGLQTLLDPAAGGLDKPAHGVAGTQWVGPPIAGHAAAPAFRDFSCKDLSQKSASLGHDL